MRSSNGSNQRTPLELVIKTLTTHIVTVANFAYFCSLLRRPTRNHLFALRIIFFAFVPTLILVEVISTAVHGLIQFLRNAVDEEDIQPWFDISAALGMHAVLPKSDSNPSPDPAHNVPLLRLSSNTVERKRTKLDWAWAGKLAASVFALLQAVGTIVMYARRLDSGHSDCLRLDHRNGAMGIASTICSTASIIILLMRFEWKVSHSYQAPAADKSLSPKSQLAAQALLALTTQLSIASIFSEENQWLYSSAGVIYWVVIGPPYGHWSFWRGWQSILLGIFIFVFRKELAARLGIDSGRVQRFLGHRSWKRVKILLGLCLVIWLLFDVVWRLVFDIIEVIDKRDDEWFWWQDPISDRIFVI